MKKMRQSIVTYILSFFVTATILNIAVGSSCDALPFTFNIDPVNSFIRVDTFPTSAIDDNVPVAQAIDLAALGILSGQTIRLEQLGFFDKGLAFVDDETDMIGVFSTSPSIAPPVNSHRVPGALEAGTDFVTLVTSQAGFATDIPEDFLITDIFITVPAFAQYLIVAAADNFYSDNTDPNGDFAVRISAAPVPEPTTIALLGIGLVGLAGAEVRRRRKKKAVDKS